MSNFINKDISKMDYQDGRDHKLAKMAYVESELGLTMPDLTDNEITVLAKMYKGAGDPTDKMKYFEWFKNLKKKYQILVVALAVIVVMYFVGLF